MNTTIIMKWRGMKSQVNIQRDGESDTAGAQRKSEAPNKRNSNK